jgi:hypothetical protein
MCAQRHDFGMQATWRKVSRPPQVRETKTGIFFYIQLVMHSDALPPPVLTPRTFGAQAECGQIAYLQAGPRRAAPLARVSGRTGSNDSAPAVTSGEQQQQQKPSPPQPHLTPWEDQPPPSRRPLIVMTQRCCSANCTLPGHGLLLALLLFWSGQSLGFAPSSAPAAASATFRHFRECLLHS